MDQSDESRDSARWFFETIFRLREEMTDEEFETLRAWIEFVAEEQATAH